MSKQKKEGLFDKAKRKLKGIVEDIGGLVDEIDKDITRAMYVPARPETEGSIKAVENEIENTLRKLKASKQYDPKSPDVAAAEQMLIDFKRARKQLDEDFSKIDTAKPPIQTAGQWNEAVNKFNEACVESIKQNHAPMIQAPGIWNSVKSALNKAIDFLNDAFELKGGDKIKPFKLDETALSRSSVNLKSQLDQIKNDMVDNEPSMSPKP